MNKKTFWITVTALALAVFALGGYALAERERGGTSENVCSIYGERAMQELNGALHDMSGAMEKSLYATDAAYLSSLLAEAAAGASSAVTALSAMPNVTYDLSASAEYVNRAGDYLLCLSKSAAGGELLSDKQRGELRELRGAVELMSERTALLLGLVREGAIGLDHYGELAAEESENTVGRELKLMESELPELPELCYDGAYASDRDKEPQLIKDLPEVSAEEAREAAAELLGVEASELEPAGETAGEIPAWHFSHSAAKGDIRRAAVTKKGGVAYSLSTTRAPTEGDISEESAAETAAEFLSRLGYEGMRELSRERQGGLLAIRLCPVTGEVWRISESVSVSIALDTGEAHSFEAGSYLMNRSASVPPAPGVDAESAARALPEGMTVRSERLIWERSEGGKEKLLYEFGCESVEGEQISVFVDAFSGKQTKIEILEA